jgi:cell division protein FtsW
VTATVREGASWHYLARQLVFIGLSAPIAWFLSRFDYRRLRNTSWVLWVGGVGLLVVTLLLGIVRGGARRWIPLGLFNLQPSELAKIACILLVSSIALEWMQRKTPTNTFLGRVGMAVGVPAVLVMLQPDFGTTLTLIASVGIVLILAGIDWKWVVGAFAGVVAFAALAIAAEPYRAQRFLAFLDPWSDPQGRGYQTVQALLAFGTGGIDGVGLGLSRQKFFYLPEAHNDFILAIIGEEIGLLGTLSVVAGIALFTWAGFRIAIGTRDPFGKLVAGGLTGMLAFQAALNMAAVTGLIPVTGKPLPFVSYGGSSILVTLICLGLILSVSEYGALVPRAVRPRRNEEPRRESARERRGDRRPHLSRVDGGRAARRRA